jgi:hypothetical protein
MNFWHFKNRNPSTNNKKLAQRIARAIDDHKGEIIRYIGFSPIDWVVM